MPAHAEFPTPTERHDRFGRFRFRLTWEGRHVAGFSKVGALTRTTQVVTHRAGGDQTTPRRMPGQSEFAAITLERGVTHDAAFAQWANKVWDYRHAGQGGSDDEDVSLADFRKDVVLEMYNEAGQRALAYTIYRCWPAEFIALPELDGDGNSVAIAMLKLENEGWERDTSIAEPVESDVTSPAR